ncbi:MAG TPA: hypothetical protein PLH97_12520, partial [Verrucomicrobiota bacterium]|nr:hypothetical protein [Verrucomicrobiota bacterium]
LCAAVALLTACNRQDDSGSAGASESGSTLSDTAAGLKDTAQQVVDGVKQTADKAGAEVARQAEQLQAEAQSLIDKAKTLIAEKNYEDALKTLTNLSNFKLTPEQQKTVDNLKAQLQQLMSNPAVSNAASAVGNLLNR